MRERLQKPKASLDSLPKSSSQNLIEIISNIQALCNIFPKAISLIGSLQLLEVKKTKQPIATSKEFCLLQGQKETDLSSRTRSSFCRDVGGEKTSLTLLESVAKR